MAVRPVAGIGRSASYKFAASPLAFQTLAIIKAFAEPGSHTRPSSERSSPSEMSAVAQPTKAELEAALRAFLNGEMDEEFPRPPAKRAEWAERIANLDRISLVEASQIYTDLAKKDTLEFRKALQPVVTRISGRLKTFEDEILSSPERLETKYGLSRPTQFLKARWIKSPFAALKAELENFRLADPGAPEGSAEAKDGGTPWLHRFIWVLVNMGSYAVPAALVIHEGYRFSGASMTSGFARALAISVGKGIEPLSNFDVMFDSFKDWTALWLMGPSMFQLGPSFAPGGHGLLSNTPYLVGTTIGAAALTMSPAYGLQLFTALREFLWVATDPTITDEQGVRAVTTLVEGMRIDKRDINQIQNAFVQKNHGILGNQSKISPAATKAVAQMNAAIDRVARALKSASAATDRPVSASSPKFEGEEWAQRGLFLFAGLLYAARIGTAISEPFLAMSIGSYAAYAMIKMWISTGGATVKIGQTTSITIGGDPNQRFQDTLATFSVLAASALPQLIMQLANLIVDLKTGTQAMDGDIAFAVTIVGLVTLNLTVNTQMGVMGANASLRLIEYLSGGQLNLLAKGQADNAPVDIRPSTCLGHETASEIRAFLDSHMDWSRIPAEPIPEDPARPNEEEEEALAAWQEAAEKEMLTQVANYLLPMLAESDDPLRFDHTAFIDHFLAYATPALVGRRNEAYDQLARSAAASPEPTPSLRSEHISVRHSIASTVESFTSAVSRMSLGHSARLCMRGKRVSWGDGVVAIHGEDGIDDEGEGDGTDCSADHAA